MELNKEQQAVSDYLEANYAAANSMAEADFTLTSKEFYNNINNSFPDFFNEGDFIRLLITLGFKFTDNQLEFEWMLKRR